MVAPAASPAIRRAAARIEAPYRRSAKGLSMPTAQDYDDMIDATEKMKVILKGMVANLTAHDYLNAEAFIDRLATQARERLWKRPRRPEVRWLSPQM